MRSKISALLFMVVAATGVSARADTVTCKDGTTSESGRGACSHHGGIERARKHSEARAKARHERTRETTTVTRDRDTKVEVRCEDGSTSTASRGACSHHGGIAGHTAQSRTQHTTRRTRIEHRDDTDLEPREETRDDHVRRDTGAVRRDKEENQPTAVCKDGEISYAAHHQGACSNHGGVERWF